MKTPRHRMRCTGSSVSYLASRDAKLSTATSWPFTTFCLLAALTILNIAPAAFAQDQPKRLVALLDYLGSDYKNAVRDGKVLSQDEYGEMQEFSRRSLDLFKQLKEIDKADKAGVEPALKSLASQIENKADPKTVLELAKRTKEKLIAAYNIVPYPRQLPTFASGKKLYDENCAQCHGAPARATARAASR